VRTEVLRHFRVKVAVSSARVLPLSIAIHIRFRGNLQHLLTGFVLGQFNNSTDMGSAYTRGKS
jgi:hypothetical protein